MSDVFRSRSFSPLSAALRQGSLHRCFAVAPASWMWPAGRRLAYLPCLTTPAPASRSLLTLEKSRACTRDGPSGGEAGAGAEPVQGFLAGLICATRLASGRGKQGKSGLGSEAQEAALARFAEAEGFAYLQTFSETESGSATTTIDPSLRRPLKRPARLALRSSWQSSID
jgi:hypothetical protein